jgi:hypothetical protein
LSFLVDWLKSYKPEELFNAEVDSDRREAHHQGRMADGIISEKALRIIPKNQKHRMGMAEASGRLLSMKAVQLMTSGDLRRAHPSSCPRVAGLWPAEGRGDFEYEGVSPTNLS